MQFKSNEIKTINIKNSYKSRLNLALADNKITNLEWQKGHHIISNYYFNNVSIKLLNNIMN